MEGKEEGGTNEEENKEAAVSEIAHCCSRKYPRREKYPRKGGGGGEHPGALGPNYRGQNFNAEIPDEVRGSRRRRAARCWRSRRLPNTARPATEPLPILAVPFISHL